MATLQGQHITKNKLAMLLATFFCRVVSRTVLDHSGEKSGRNNGGGTQTQNAETTVKAVSSVSILLPSGTKYWQALNIAFRCTH